jgi:putative Mg2+ transporter-C (MgtC) family protein
MDFATSDHAPVLGIMRAMELVLLPTFIHLFAAALAGALIGLERTYHGRPAGFRTHVLVCTASSVLMVLGTAEAASLSGLPPEAVRVDPARMAQGIMTGIGFLGAGVIMKDGFSVRGLTTAASIWMTAAIGIIIGAGFYFPALVATLLTLATLSLFRWIERVFPSLVFARLIVRCARSSALTEDALRALIEQQKISATHTSYRMAGEGKWLEYEMTVQSRRALHFRRLAEHLSTVPQVVEYSLAPAAEK